MHVASTPSDAARYPSSPRIDEARQLAGVPAEIPAVVRSEVEARAASHLEQGFPTKYILHDAAGHVKDALSRIDKFTRTASTEQLHTAMLIARWAASDLLIATKIHGVDAPALHDALAATSHLRFAEQQYTEGAPIPPSVNQHVDAAETLLLATIGMTR